MPRGDGTGPRGQGPLTGRGLGNCKRVERTDALPNRGMGGGLGYGAGMANRNRNRNRGNRAV
jgi:hypothetical protein